MPGAASVHALLTALDPEQRAAAALPDGPAQIIAPAGSGKTTTLIARLGVLIDRGHEPERILVLTFNRDAAGELRARIASRLAPLVPSAERIEVRTLHAIGRRILLDSGWRGRLIAERSPLLRAARRAVALASQDAPTLPTLDELDTAVSAVKLGGRSVCEATAAVIAEYQTLLDRRCALDFDDLVARAVALLRGDAALRATWQARFNHVLVDEFQDVDAAQLRLISLLAEPERNVFAVGDDDQTIYAWRLADVRRILDFDRVYPDARRVMLATNYRCPAAVVGASRRLIGVNLERFAKPIDAAPGSCADPRDVATFPLDVSDWPHRLAELAKRRADAGSRVCFLARTRAELMPVALALIRRGVRHAMAAATPIEAGPVINLMDVLRHTEGEPYAVIEAARRARGWHRAAQEDDLSPDEHDAVDALLGWASAYRDGREFVTSFDAARARLSELRRPDAPVHLMTVHGAKGLEFPLVVVVGFEEDRFPNRRAVVSAADPARALEDERRLAYVALTRASEQLVLAFHPDRPSRFVAELGVPIRRPRVRRR
ncbi:MAG: ATP-dependent helicase [Candidatus Limnocylindria bacterium]